VKRPRIRTRLTALYGVLFLLAGAGMLGFTYLLVQQSFNDRLPGGGLAVQGGVGGPASPAAGQQPSAPPDPHPSQPSPDQQTITTANGRTITLAQAAQEEIARERKFRADTLNSLLTRGGIALGGFAVVAVGFGWLMADRALRPLHQITATARRVASGNLRQRIALTGPPDEMKELADTFDSMLERLDRAFDGQRRFVDNASHELRTPLAINRTLIQVALGHPDTPAQTHQLGETLLAVNTRHERLIDGLLTLASSEQAITVRESVDLAEVVQRVFDQTASPSGLHLGLSLDPARTSGDPVLLERLVHNLVRNAVAYNVPDGWISAHTRTDGEQVELVIANAGPVIPAYEIPGLFEPFRRLRDRVGSADGTGLGLSIVRSVVVAHGGTVTAEPGIGGGLRVRVRLPA
jgi:signal transduction histidine kinase